MPNQNTTNQSAHDDAVRAVENIYRKKGKTVSINPGGEKNEERKGYYIDVIAKETSSSGKAWVIEIETSDSVSKTETHNQWANYDDVYTVWHLAVPVESKNEAIRLLKQLKIKNCGEVITWERNDEGGHTFWGLPGT